MVDDALEQLHFVIALGQPHEGIQLVGDVVYYVVLLFVFRVATTAAGGRLEGRAHGGGEERSTAIATAIAIALDKG